MEDGFRLIIGRVCCRYDFDVEGQGGAVEKRMSGIARGFFNASVLRKVRGDIDFDGDLQPLTQQTYPLGIGITGIAA